jgi:hypothetical protein
MHNGVYICTFEIFQMKHMFWFGDKSIYEGNFQMESIVFTGILGRRFIFSDFFVCRISLNFANDNKSIITESI